MKFSLITKILIVVFLDFIGVSSSDLITKISFIEDTGVDDIGIANFRFTDQATIPELSTYVLFCTIIGVSFFLQRRKKVLIG